MATAEISAEVLLASRIPKRFWNARLKTFFGSPNARKAVSTYLDASDLPDIGLFLRGKSCGGKTYLAAFVLLTMLSREHNAVYFTLDDLTDLYFGRLDDSKESFSSRILGPKYLCIDNVNSPTGNGHKLALLRAVRLRSDNDAPYMVCSRLTDDELLTLYGTVSENPSAETLEEGDLLGFFQRDLLAIDVPAVPMAVAQYAENRKAKYVT